MTDNLLLGTKLKTLRRREALSQAQLALKLGVSPSYLNLIENNKRPLPAALLLKLVDLFKLDLAALGGADDARLANDLMEVFGDPVFEDRNLANTDVREFAVAQPVVARAVLSLYQKYKEAREGTHALAARLSDGDVGDVSSSQLPSEEVNDFLQRRSNHLVEVEEAAERLWRVAPLDKDDLFRSLARHLERAAGISVRVTRPGSDPGTVRRFDPAARLITLDEQLPPRTRTFQLAHQAGLILESAFFDRVAADPVLTTPESRTLARVAVANYFAGAIMMPYEAFLEAARSERYDIELLGHRFRCSFEQVAHRLTTLRRPGREGVPFHFLRIDIAGNISKRYSGSGIRFARFAGACPRWNVHTAFMTPGMIRVQISEMPDSSVFFCLARTVRRDSGGYLAQHTVHAIGLGCRVEHARDLVYSDGMDLTNTRAIVPVGVTCRLCERMDCEQRVFPSMQSPLRIDENVRGVSFYAPAPKR